MVFCQWWLVLRFDLLCTFKLAAGYFPRCNEWSVDTHKIRALAYNSLWKTHWLLSNLRMTSIFYCLISDCFSDLLYILVFDTIISIDFYLTIFMNNWNKHDILQSKDFDRCLSSIVTRVFISSYLLSMLKFFHATLIIELSCIHDNI